MADRFYCPEPLVDGMARLEGDEARHLARVRRVGPGEKVELFDGRGTAYQAEVVAIGRDRVELRVVAILATTGPQACRLTLATSLPKGDRVDWLVEKATELGVDRLIPLITERSVVDPRGAKLDRLRRVVVEASKQCRRNRLMELGSPVRWSEVVAMETHSARLIAEPGGRGLLTSGLSPKVRSAILAIGPEGGFTSDELNQAIEVGWTPLSLGATILRIETAALAGCSRILALVEPEGVAGQIEEASG